MLLNDYQLPSHNLRIQISTQFDSKDMSGESSSTSDAHTGIKAKIISVSLMIRFVDVSLLSELYGIAEAIDDNGDLFIYRITNISANAANILQAKFHGQLNVSEHRSLDAWTIRFQLKEHLSVPEKKEQIQNTVQEDSDTDNETITPDQIEVEASLTGLEKVLQKIDNSLA